MAEGKASRCWPGRPVRAEIDLDAIEHNVRAMCRKAAPASVLAVVKANGYGHGAVAVSQAALSAGASSLGVACVDEGIQLRRAGVTAPILVMGFIPPWEAAVVVEHGLTPTATTKQTALALARFSRERGVKTPVHLKVDTGMARLGLTPPEVATFGAYLETMEPLALAGIYTHFASADQPDKSFTREQYAAFRASAESLPASVTRHVANSATLLDIPEMYLDMVRPGISIYGCYPSAHTSRSIELRPVLNLKSQVARIHTLPAGATVGYGRTWRTEKPARIALIPCGYADGIPRGLSNKGAVLVRGRRAPIVGRVCMDQVMVDVTGIPRVTLGDEVVLIGRQGDEHIPVEEVAQLAGTINYEILCALSARVPRVYLRGGRVVSVQTLTGEL